MSSKHLENILWSKSVTQLRNHGFLGADSSVVYIANDAGDASFVWMAAVWQSGVPNFSARFPISQEDVSPPYAEPPRRDDPFLPPPVYSTPDMELVEPNDRFGVADDSPDGAQQDSPASGVDELFTSAAESDSADKTFTAAIDSSTSSDSSTDSTEINALNPQAPMPSEPATSPIIQDNPFEDSPSVAQDFPMPGESVAADSEESLHALPKDPQWVDDPFADPGQHENPFANPGQNNDPFADADQAVNNGVPQDSQAESSSTNSTNQSDDSNVLTESATDAGLPTSETTEEADVAQQRNVETSQPAEQATVVVPVMPAKPIANSWYEGLNPLWLLAVIPFLLAIVALRWLFRNDSRKPVWDEAKKARGKFKKSARFQSDEEVVDAEADDSIAAISRSPDALDEVEQSIDDVLATSAFGDTIAKPFDDDELDFEFDMTDDESPVVASNKDAELAGPGEDDDVLSEDLDLEMDDELFADSKKAIDSSAGTISSVDIATIRTTAEEAVSDDDFDSIFDDEDEASVIQASSSKSDVAVSSDTDVKIDLEEREIGVIMEDESELTMEIEGDGELNADIEDEVLFGESKEVDFDRQLQPTIAEPESTNQSDSNLKLASQLEDENEIDSECLPDSVAVSADASEVAEIEPAPKTEAKPKRSLVSRITGLFSKKKSVEIPAIESAVAASALAVPVIASALTDAVQSDESDVGFSGELTDGSATESSEFGVTESQVDFDVSEIDFDDDQFSEPSVNTDDAASDGIEESVELTAEADESPAEAIESDDETNDEFDLGAWDEDASDEILFDRDDETDSLPTPTIVDKAENNVEDQTEEIAINEPVAAQPEMAVNPDEIEPTVGELNPDDESDLAFDDSFDDSIDGLNLEDSSDDMELDESVDEIEFEDSSDDLEMEDSVVDEYEIEDGLADESFVFETEESLAGLDSDSIGLEMDELAADESESEAEQVSATESDTGAESDVVAESDVTLEPVINVQPAITVASGLGLAAGLASNMGETQSDERSERESGLLAQLESLQQENRQLLEASQQEKLTLTSSLESAQSELESFTQQQQQQLDELRLEQQQQLESQQQRDAEALELREQWEQQNSELKQKLESQTADIQQQLESQQQRDAEALELREQWEQQNSELKQKLESQTAETQQQLESQQQRDAEALELREQWEQQNSELKQRLESQTVEIQQQLESQQQRDAEALELREQWEQQNSELKQKSETLQEEIQQQQSEIPQQHEIQQELETIAVEKRDLQQQLADLEAAQSGALQAKVDELAQLNPQLEELRESLSNLEKENQELREKLEIAQSETVANTADDDEPVWGSSLSSLVQDETTPAKDSTSDQHELNEADSEKSVAAQSAEATELSRKTKEKFTKLYRSYERERKLRKESELFLTEAEEQRNLVAATLHQLKKELSDSHTAAEEAAGTPTESQLETQQQDVERLLQLESENSRLNQQLAEFSEIESKAADLQAKLADAESNFAQSKSNLAETESQRAAAESKLADLETKLAELSAAETKVVDSECKLAETEARLADLETKREESETKIADLASQLSRSEKDLAESKSSLVAAESKETEDSANEIELAEVEAKLVETEKRLADSEARILDAESQSAAATSKLAQAASSSAEIASRLAIAEQKVSESESKIAERQSNISGLEVLRAETDSKLSTVANALALAEQTGNQAEQKLQRLQSERDELLKKSTELEVKAGESVRQVSTLQADFESRLAESEKRLADSNALIESQAKQKTEWEQREKQREQQVFDLVARVEMMSATVERVDSLQRNVNELKTQHQQEVSQLRSALSQANEAVAAPSGSLFDQNAENKSVSLMTGKTETSDKNRDADVTIDKLTRIDGIGKVTQQKLNRLGVTSFEQIANWTAADIADFSEQLSVNENTIRDVWIVQSKQQ